MQTLSFDPGRPARQVGLRLHFTDEETEAPKISCPDIQALWASSHCPDLRWQRHLKSPLTPLAGTEPLGGTLNK